MRTVDRRSLILSCFSKEDMFELEKITLIPGCNNNQRGELVKEYVKDLSIRKGIVYESLGIGTNRIGLKLDGYVVKVSLDSAGKTDNKREMKYSKRLQPYVTKTYECLPSGLMATSEYIVPFGIDDYHERKGQMKKILDDISSMGYLIGDVGITGKNYVNWGIRTDNTVAILDFAYIYDVKFNTFKCSECEDESFLKWDESYIKLTCPSCGAKYEFGEIRRRISREQQEKEIGDIRLMGYNLTSPLETVEYNSAFEYEPTKKKKKKEMSEADRRYKEYKEEQKSQQWF